MSEPSPVEFAWVGSQEPCLDSVEMLCRGPVVIGRYGGRTSAGATKNEDGALVWSALDDSWEFAALLDAHYTAESAELVIEMLLKERPNILRVLSGPPAQALPQVQQTLLRSLMAPEFRARCQEVTGETSVFFAARSGRYLWWLSIGDCMGYLLHPELARLDSYALNQRAFFEWVGKRNTFEHTVPNFSQGTRRLLDGTSTILLTTDGLLEFGSHAFSQPEMVYRTIMGNGGRMPALREAVEGALDRVHKERGRDSATMLAWRIHNGQPLHES